MTMNLITGKAGAPHITSSDQGAMQAGLVGNGNYLLQGGDGKFPAVTMQSSKQGARPGPQPCDRRTVRTRHRGGDRHHRKRSHRTEPQRPNLREIHARLEQHRNDRARGAEGHRHQWHGG